MSRGGGRSGTSALTRALLWSGVAAGPLFVTVFTTEGARRPGYRPARHPVSSLSLGPRGWVQVANFTAAGTLLVAGAAGLSRARADVVGTRLVPGLVGAAGVGLLISAAFPTDPVGGYPPGTPDALPAPSAAMIGHEIGAIPVFLGLPAAALACAWRFGRSGHAGWAVYSAATAASVAANMGFAGAGFSQSAGMADRGGLFQRAAIITAFGWITALSARSLRRGTPA
jgi:hypothetical protein